MYIHCTSIGVNRLLLMFIIAPFYILILENINLKVYINVIYAIIIIIVIIIIIPSVMTERFQVTKSDPGTRVSIQASTPTVPHYGSNREDTANG